MLKLYHAPRTRSLRIVWLFEELGVPYELATVGFEPPSRPFSQHTPTGKFPTLEDGEVTMFESGAIAEYILERYGNGRLAPAIGTPARAAFLQWMHFAEGAFVPFGNIAWHMLFKHDADRIPDVMEDYRGWARAAGGARTWRGRQVLPVGRRALGGRRHDGIHRRLRALVRHAGQRVPNLNAYLDRLEARPAFARRWPPDQCAAGSTFQRTLRRWRRR